MHDLSTATSGMFAFYKRAQPDTVLSQLALAAKLADQHTQCNYS